MSFRESLEAFLIIVILLKFIQARSKKDMSLQVWCGVLVGTALSILLAVLLSKLNLFIEHEHASMIWEVLTSIIAVVLVTFFILWMIRHSDNIRDHVENHAQAAMTGYGIFLLSIVMVSREGIEIVLFSMAGKYSLISVLIGIFVALIIALLIYYSLLKVNLALLFNITLIYLILQAGFLFGYGVHEGLESLEASGILSEESALMQNAFDFKGTQFDHDESLPGIILSSLFGWYSHPQWLQFIIQYLYTLSLFAYWYLLKKSTHLIDSK